MTKPARKSTASKPRKLLPPLESAEDFCDRIERAIIYYPDRKIRGQEYDNDATLRQWFIVQLLARDGAVRAHALREAKS